MLQTEEFASLLRRVRAGDARAAEQLVREYEPEIRRALRVHLTEAGLRRLFDSMDICQSVFANFFVRAAAGQFELDSPDKLFKLLITMARNRLRDLTRRQHAARRDQGRLEGNAEGALAALADPEATPSQLVTGQELLAELRRRLSDEERELAEQWAQGREWKELAAERGRGEGADALRKRFARAVSRVARELGLEDVDDE